MAADPTAAAAAAAAAGLAPPVAAPAQQPVEYSVFVGDLAPDVSDFLLQESFRQFYPSATSAKVITDPATGRSKGYGFVRFSSEAERDRALEMQGFNLSGRPIRVSLATARRNAGGGGGAPLANSVPHPADLDPTNTTLFIGGLSAGVSEDQLRMLFGQYGDTVYVKIPAGKGCGFVQFVERPAAEMAMAALNGTVLGANAIRISWGRSTSRAPVARDAAFGTAAGGMPGAPQLGVAVGAYPAAAFAGGPGAAFGGFGGAGMLPGYGPAGGLGISAAMMLPGGGGIMMPAGGGQALALGAAGLAGVHGGIHGAGGGGAGAGGPHGFAVGAPGMPGMVMHFDPSGGSGVDKMTNAALVARQQQLLGGGGPGANFLLPRT
ncbi:hypothetical protein Rsub_06873 [Raphidocelis subcapitata]|uniref:RRM domain-containing protein n=1 Tax=Raphidocelis subcapitata TaxID=307507 RepID=A0A2V0P1X2_9CHLO|nr:hypothetical protein Rsub_06873 [Raphidocelis subcapitata]|eukprot:GBF93874.1 hypothetical protein Rsub_06873 [Raphidocelis subcapitata]